jgi:UPF0755 protein
MTSSVPITPAPKSGSSFARLLLIALLLAAPPLLAVAIAFMPGPLTDAKTIVVAHGTRVSSIAATLEQGDIAYNRYIFRLAARLLAGDQLKAGEYAFAPHQSTADIVLMMRDGRSVVRLFTVAEGLSSIEIAHMLQSNPALTGDMPPAAEGSLLPETYRYSYDDSRAGLIVRMQKAMEETLSDLWPKRDPGLPLKSPQEALIMASIIEKETGKPEERPRVARVFYNRLAHNMRLQSDPTVIYAINKGDGPLDHELDHADLAFNSPYNTYTNDGLPPGPICNPGRASLEAALHPEPNDYLYFVADGTGGHVFSNNLVEHNQNVTKWNAMKAQENVPPGVKPAAP